MTDEILDYKVITLPTYCLERKLKSFTFGNGSYLYDDTYDNVYEIFQFFQDKRSWFVGEIVIQDGSLQMITRVDPLFIILPHLIGSKKLFKTLLDILEGVKGSETLIKIFETDKKALIRSIVETKELDDEIYYRLDEKKLSTWLKAKVTQIIKCLQLLNINVSIKSTKVSDFSSARAIKIDEEEYTIYALKLLSKYLPDDLIEQLRETYNITIRIDADPLPESKPISSSTPKGQKRNIDAHKCEPIDNYCTGEVQASNGLQAKKLRLTKSQKELEKASKQSGIRSVSSFFTKKPATAK